MVTVDRGNVLSVDGQTLVIKRLYFKSDFVHTGFTGTWLLVSFVGLSQVQSKSVAD